MKKKIEAAVPRVTNCVYKINIFRNGHKFWSSSFLRMSMYCIGAILTAFLTATDKVIDTSDLTNFQWVKVACGCVAAGGIAIRAFVDQTMARNSDTGKPKIADSPEKIT